MTFTYTAGATTNLNRVRRLIGDTSNTAAVYLVDEEINDILAQHSNLYVAAAMACEMKAALWADYVSTSNVGGLSVSAGDRYEHYMKLADRLRKYATLRAVPLVGGMNIVDVDALDDNADLIQPKFKVGMDGYRTQHGVDEETDD